MNKMSKLIELQNISLTINNKKIIDNLSLIIKREGVSIITGHNGAGKSTLLRLMAGFIEPSKGSIMHHDVDDKSPVGFVFQKSILLNRSVKDNLFHALRCVKQCNIFENENIIGEILKNNNVDHLSEMPAQKLSIGEQQVISMLRSLIIQPYILYLDEPTSSLDPQYTKIVEDLIIKASKNIKVVLVTQSTRHLKMFDNDISYLSQGKLNV
jgi:ABC-type multidrug transport system ATPase subunit